MTTRRPRMGVRKDSPAKLSLVGTQQDSTDTSEPKSRKGDTTAAREASQRAHDERALLRAQGARSNMERYLAGEYPIEEWTLEEVRKARPYNMVDNTWSGHAPRWDGKTQAAIKRELMRRGQQILDDAYPEALKILFDIARHGETESARVKALSLIMDRAVGKVPDKVEIKSSDPWQDILDDIMADEVLERVSNPIGEEAN